MPLRILFVQLLNNFLNLFHRVVSRSVVHHDDLQLIRRVVLVHTRQDGALDPCFLIEARNDHRHPRRVVDIHRHRLVENGKEIAGQQKAGGDDAVKVQKFIEFEINHRLCPHEQNDEGNTEKQKRRYSDKVLAPLPLVILCQRLFEMNAQSRAPIFLERAHHFAGKATHFHLVAFGHIAGTDFKRELHLFRRFFHLLPDVIHKEHAGRGNIQTSAPDFPLHAAFLPGEAHGNLHFKTAARFRAGHIFFKILLPPDFIPFIGLTTIHIRPLARDIRHMRKHSPVFLQLLQSIFFLHEFSCELGECRARWCKHSGIASSC